VIRGIDHIVLAVPDPDSAAESLEAALGLRATGGGRHEQLGTYNRIVWCGDSYLELIAAFDPRLAAGTWLGRPVLAVLETGGGLVSWAVAIDDLDAQLRWMGRDGELTGPIDGERHRPDGRIVRWRLAHPAMPSPSSPFLIEHDVASAEWTPDERRARASETHPLGGRVRIASLELQSDAPAAVAGRLRSMLGTSVEPDGRRGVRVVVGVHTVGVATPRPERTTRAVVELVTDISMRRRSTRVGDCEIRVSGARPSPAPVAGDGRSARASAV
jgi:catechol 2,3-dioxygenase-like lactoylglutathione lyase family enzyme